jgi:hypothetical protein
MAFPEKAAGVKWLLPGKALAEWVGPVAKEQVPSLSIANSEDICTVGTTLASTVPSNREDETRCSRHGPSISQIA